MSDDIVERLRRIAASQPSVAADAISEILQLRAEVRVKRQAEAAAIAAGKRAVELRAALERIAATGNDGSRWEVQIARAALAGQSPAPQAPIARVTVEDSGIVSWALYAPGWIIVRSAEKRP